MWYTEFNGTFWITISGAVLAFFGLVVRAGFKSKCVECDCCGLHIKRDAQAENAEPNEQVV